MLTAYAIVTVYIHSTGQKYKTAATETSQRIETNNVGMIIHPHTSVPHRYHNIWIAIVTVYCSSACIEFHVVYVPVLQSLGLNNYYHQTLYIAITDAFSTYTQTLHTHICTCIHTCTCIYYILMH